MGKTLKSIVLASVIGASLVSPLAKADDNFSSPSNPLNPANTHHMANPLNPIYSGIDTNKKNDTHSTLSDKQKGYLAIGLTGGFLAGIVAGTVMTGLIAYALYLRNCRNSERKS